jgi:hypothetical protein
MLPAAPTMIDLENRLHAKEAVFLFAIPGWRSRAG